MRQVPEASSPASFHLPLSLAVALMTASCGPSPSTRGSRICSTSQPVGESGAPLSALFVADAQIHNMTGSRVRTMSGAADMIVGVSVRPSELNALAHIVLEDLLSTYVTSTAASESGVFYLGDAINLSCAGELLAFESSVDAATAGVPWFMAHGNHDSFFSGMYNHFGTDIVSRSAISRVAERGLIGSSGGIASIEEMAWISADDSREGAYSDNRGAHSVCATPSGVAGFPMNKFAWLAWYARNLVEQGVVFTKLGESLEGEVPRQILGRGAVGDFSVEVSGRLHVPTANESVMESWRSYIVQTVRHDNVTVVLVDTSVGAHFGRRLSDTAAQVGQLGDEQMDELRNILEAESRGGRRVFVAGHFPLSDIHPNELSDLLELFSKHNVISYFSAHTHAPTASISVSHVTSTNGLARDSCTQEFNIGSTTDWPMEALVATLHTPTVGTRVIQAGRECGVRYQTNVPRSLNRRQACAHQAQVTRLASISEEDAQSFLTGGGDWVSIESDSNCNLQEAAEAIERAMVTINARRADRTFRDFYLCIATAASATECGEHHDSRCDARLLSRPPLPAPRATLPNPGPAIPAAEATVPAPEAE